MSLMTAVAFLTTSWSSEVEVVDSQTSDLMLSAKVTLRPSRDITKPSEVTVKRKIRRWRYLIRVGTVKETQYLSGANV